MGKDLLRKLWGSFKDSAPVLHTHWCRYAQSAIRSRQRLWLWRGNDQPRIPNSVRVFSIVIIANVVIIIIHVAIVVTVIYIFIGRGWDSKVRSHRRICREHVNKIRPVNVISIARF